MCKLYKEPQIPVEGMLDYYTTNIQYYEYKIRDLENELAQAKKRLSDWKSNLVTLSNP